jgi:hypothetical protein
MFKQAVDPKFKTDTKDYSRVEAAKINSNELNFILLPFWLLERIQEERFYILFQIIIGSSID